MNTSCYQLTCVTQGDYLTQKPKNGGDQKGSRILNFLKTYE
jgi:hypothetical protein